MTEQEAVEVIKNVYNLSCPSHEEEILFEDAINLAIQALETMQELKKRNLTIADLENYMQFEDECVKKGFSFNKLLEGLEKQIPKKTVKKTWWHTCPCCGNHDISEQYCDRCGQKLDWGNENDD